MTLATHIVVGAATARALATSPIQAFILGWISHYIMDSIIHWDYPLKTFEGNHNDPTATKIHFNRDIFLDMAKVLLDVGLGFIIVLLATDEFTRQNFFLVLAGAVGGGMPDFIQFLYGAFKTKSLTQPLTKPLEIMQRFHNFMHASRDLKSRPVIGIAIQVCIILVVSFFI